MLARRPSGFLSFSLLLAGLLASRPTAQAVRISGELARGNLHLGTAALAPDGRHVAFAGRYSISAPTINTLYGVSTEAGAEPVVLYDDSGIPPDEGREFDLGTVTFVRITPDSRHVLFLVDERYSLFSVAVDGSEPFQSLAQANPFEPFEIAPDGSRAAFTNLEYVDNVVRAVLRSVPIDGSASSVRLAAAAEGARVLEFRIDSTSRRVVYLEGDDGGLLPRALFSVPLDGSEPPVRLSPRPRAQAATLGRSRGEVPSVISFALSPAGGHVLLRTSGPGGLELFSVPADGSQPPLRLARGDVRAAAFTRDSDRIVHGDGAGLFVQAVDGSERLLLHEPEQPVERLEMLADAVLFVDRPAGAGECLFQVPLDGSTPARPVGARVAGDRTVREFHAAPDDTLAVYSADAATPGVFTLFAASLAGTGPLSSGAAAVVPLDVPADVQRFEFTPDSAAVLAQVSAPGGNALERVPVSGAPARRLSGSEGVSDLLVDAAGTLAVYRGVHEHDTRLHVYQVALDEDAPAVQLDAFGPVLGSIGGYEIHPAGDRAVYMAGARDFAHVEPHVVPLDLSAPPRRIEGVLEGEERLRSVRIEPVSNRLIAAVGHPDSFDSSIVSVPLDGPAERAVLGHEVLQHELAGDHVLLVTREESRADLYTVPADGSGDPVLLTPATLSPLVDGRLYDFLVGPGAQRVAFTAITQQPSRWELFTAPADGSQAAVRLNPTPVAGGGLERGSERFTVDGSRVVFVGDLTRNDAFGLWVAPSDGSAPAIELWSAPAGREVTLLEPTPDSSRAVFVADLEAAGRHRLYVVPLDGSQPPSALPRAEGDPEVFALRLTPDGTQAVYKTNDNRLVAVALDGATDARVLNAETPGHVATFQITDEWVGFEARTGTADRFDLFVAPLDGSAAPRRVNDVVSERRNLEPYRFVGDEILFVSPALSDPYPYPSQLFRAALAQPSPPVPVNPPGVFSAATSSEDLFRVSADGNLVLFPAMSDSHGLYLSLLGR